MGDQSSAGQPEPHSARLDREVDELMQELRAVIPGAQVLFGLLLTVAFTERFERLGDAERYVYFGTFVSALLARAPARSRLVPPAPVPQA